MRKFLTLTLLIVALAVMSTPTIAAEHSMLPEIKGWRCGELKQTKIDTVSGYRGQWLEREYRTNDGIPFHAIWIDGAGPKGWTVPDGPSGQDKGYLKPESTYKTLKVAGRRASFEQDPLIGSSLAIRLPDGVLTLESLLASEPEAVRAAETILNIID